MLATTDNHRQPMWSWNSPLQMIRHILGLGWSDPMKPGLPAHCRGGDKYNLLRNQLGKLGCRDGGKYLRTMYRTLIGSVQIPALGSATGMLNQCGVHRAPSLCETSCSHLCAPRLGHRFVARAEI